MGSADNEEHDQVLDDINLGPIREGVSKFLFKVSLPPPCSFVCGLLWTPDSHAQTHKRSSRPTGSASPRRISWE